MGGKISRRQLFGIAGGAAVATAALTACSSTSGDVASASGDATSAATATAALGEQTDFVLHGDVCYSTNQTEVSCTEDAYLVCVGGKSAGVFTELPSVYEGLPVVDCAGQLIVPGMSDIHLHAPQYAFRGTGTDLELLDWLNTYTFPEEARYSDASYAEKAYDIFASDLRRSYTTRAVVFGTLHVEATELLMDKLEATGLVSYVGKVNMDRNGGENLQEVTADSLKDTRQWLEDVSGKYERTKPILTPRFVPACTDELMAGLQEIAAEQGLPVQSHLSENLSEIDWVKSLCPWSSCYGQAYDHFGMLSPTTVMAHCVYSSDEEVELLKSSGTYVAHCPQSNTMLSSGIAPIRRYLTEGVNVGLGSDVAGGASLSMWRVMAEAVGVSKLRWRLVDQDSPALSSQEAFWLATLGGGSYFGKVGSFEEGYEFDALVLDDSALRSPRELSLWDRLERFIYLEGEGGKLARKYVAGREVSLA